MTQKVMARNIDKSNPSYTFWVPNDATLAK